MDEDGKAFGEVAPGIVEITFNTGVSGWTDGDSLSVEGLKPGEGTDPYLAALRRAWQAATQGGASMGEDELGAETADVLYAAATQLVRRFWPGLGPRQFSLRRAALWAVMAQAVHGRLEVEGWPLELGRGEGEG